MVRQIPPPLPAALSLGVSCQLGQIVLLRELLMVFYGNELSIGIILACWMLWVGAGSGMGAFLAERSRRPFFLLALASIAMLPILPGTVLLVRILRGFFDVLPGEILTFTDTASASFLLMAPCCSLLGAQFVFLSRVWRESARAEDTSGATKTYIFESAGSILGGLGFTLVLVHFLNAFHCAFLAGMLMLAGVLWLAWTGEKGGNGLRAPLPLTALGFLLLAAIFLPFLGRLDAWATGIQWKDLAPEHPLVESRHSKYGAVTVLQRGNQYSFYQSGHLSFSTAGPREEAFEFEEQGSAVFAHLSLVQHADPKRVLLIGGGLSGVLREIARHPVESIDYVELDRVLTDMAEKYVPSETVEALRHPRVRVISADGRLTVKASDRQYDMILVDLPDPASAVVNRFYTAEFFRESKERLRPHGVFVTAVTSTAELRGSAVVNRNATLYHTLKSVFLHVLPVGERSCFFFASDSPGQVSADPEVLRARYLERKVETKGFSEWTYHTLLQESPLRRLNWILRHHGRRPGSHLLPPERGPLFPGPIADQEAEEKSLPPVDRRAFINSDFRPIGTTYTLILWNRFTRTEDTKALQWMLSVQGWWLLPIAGTLVLLVLLLRGLTRNTEKRPDTRVAVLFAIFTTGFSAMAFQIILVFSFQSLYGFVYEMIGLITAIFMGGLALGAAATHRGVKEKADTRILAVVQMAVALFACLMAVGLPAFAGLRSPAAIFLLFSGMTFLAGLMSGADFPLATSGFLALSRRPERAAGFIYGVELLGGCIGAALTSAVVIPVLGIVPSALCAGALNGTAFGILRLSRRPHD
ncbi:MAG: fused MFS/spermidine synthase [Planctomycetota bacterium]|jgi:spermidine synthase